jgi:hypothetical protein
MIALVLGCSQANINEPVQTPEPIIESTPTPEPAPTPEPEVCIVCGILKQASDHCEIPDGYVILDGELVTEEYANLTEIERAEFNLEKVLEEHSETSPQAAVARRALQRLIDEEKNRIREEERQIRLDEFLADFAEEDREEAIAEFERIEQEEHERLREWRRESFEQTLRDWGYVPGVEIRGNAADTINWWSYVSEIDGLGVMGDSRINADYWVLEEIFIWCHETKSLSIRLAFDEDAGWIIHN